MKIFYIIVGFLLLGDALFTWANMDKVSSMLSRVMPNLNIKKVIFVEGMAGALILLSQLATG